MRTLKLLCQGYGDTVAELATRINGVEIFKGPVNTISGPPPPIPVRVDFPYTEFQIPMDYQGPIQVELDIILGTVVIGDVLANYVHPSDPAGAFGSMTNPVTHQNHGNSFEINFNKIRTVDNIVINNQPVVQEFKHQIDNGVTFKKPDLPAPPTPKDIVINNWPVGRRPCWLETVYAGDKVSYTINVFVASWYQKSPVDQ
jgi:hypothetical protein